MRRIRIGFDFVRVGEISGCFTAHLVETVEDVKTINEDNGSDSETNDSSFHRKRVRVERSAKTRA